MIGLLGGTFDPVHNGHVDLATQVQQAFALERVEFLPCFQPVHREGPAVASQQRARMVELAIEHISGFRLNSTELDRAGPSYAIDTLRTLKQQHPGQTVCWLIGSDAFNSFELWKDPQGILQLANLVVCSRPGSPVDRKIFARHHLVPGDALDHYPSGRIAFYTMQPNTCSSTAVRERLLAGDAVDDCLHPAVIDFIRNNQLYVSRYVEHQ